MIYPRATEMTVPQWLQALSAPDERLRRALCALYGPDEPVHRQRLALMRRTARAAAERLPHDRPTILVRVPGRINTMGLHSDGQLSWKNHVVFGREIVGFAQRRSDDTVALLSPHERYPDHRCSIADLLPADRRGSEWADVLEESEIEPGAWQNYLIGPILALQNRFPGRPLCGMNLLVDGDIPVAAGVSSSSALATLAGIATIYFNELELEWGEAIRIIGAGEWYCGSRGGPGDTGSQMLCRLGHVLHIRYDIAFDPWEAHHLPFPDEWRIVLCDTRVEARKSVEALQTATSRGLAQASGMIILRERFPEALGDVRCLAHVSPEHIEIELADVYHMLRALPERASMEDLPRLAPGRVDELAPVMRHYRVDLPDFPLRPVCMYMICEPARGARNRPVLEARDEAEMGRLLTAAHDGDRVVRWADDEHCVPYDRRVSDELLTRLAAMAERGEEAAALHRQPGGFACSCPELDLLVDICTGVEGVIGARVTGAGMGGCMFAYVHRDAVDDVLREVGERYYRPRGLELAAWELHPVERGGPLVLEADT
ncbi:MAG: hypothetical protein U9R79_00615 [Armatimonadota bacterium]|nr:hypothetical protein [Armatimonadota bacterium]